MRKILLSVSVFLAALGFAAPVLIQGFTGSEDATEVQLTEGEEGDEPVATDADALAAAKTNATKLVEYLGAVNGLFEEQAVTDATTAIAAATDEDGVKEAKNAFLAKVKPVNVSIKSSNTKTETIPQPDGSSTTIELVGEYLCAHHLTSYDEDGNVTEIDKNKLQPHAHATFGFASIWNLVWNESGMEIGSKFYGENYAYIGPWGGGIGAGTSSKWQMDWGTYTDETGKTYEGVTFLGTAASGSGTTAYLSSRPDQDQGGTVPSLNATAIWNIERVYVPVSISFDPDQIDVEGGTSKSVQPVLVSDGGDDHPVTEGLQGVEWTSSASDKVSVAGTGRFDSMIPSEIEDARNGYLAGEITGESYNDAEGADNSATITATSVMPASQSTTSQQISGTFTATVTPGVEGEEQLNIAKSNLKGLIDALDNAGVILAGTDIATLKNDIQDTHYDTTDADIEYDTPQQANTALLPQIKVLMAAINPNALILIYNNDVSGDTTTPYYLSYRSSLNGANNVVCTMDEAGSDFFSIWRILPVQDANGYTGKIKLVNYSKNEGIGPYLTGIKEVGSCQALDLNYQTFGVGDNAVSGITFRKPDTKYITKSSNNAQTNGNTTALNNKNIWQIAPAVIPNTINLGATVGTEDNEGKIIVTTTFEPTGTIPFLDRVNYRYIEQGKTEATDSVAVTLSDDGTFEAPAATNEDVTYILTATSGSGVKVINEDGTISSDLLSATAEFTIKAAVLESLTASIPAATEMVENATERTVTLTVVPTPAIYVVKAEQLTVKIGETACEVAAGDDDNTFTVTIPEGVAVGEQTLSVSFKADDSASETAATATADGTLTLEITKAPLTALTASVTNATIFTTATGDARNITVTLTPDPTAYDLSVGKATVELVAETSTQADGEEEATTGLDITKGEDGSFTVTYAVPTDQAVGSYNVKVTYTEGEGDNIVTKDATATGTIIIATPAITSISYKDVTDNAIALTIAKGATEITKDIVIEAVPEGAVFTGKTVTFTAAVAEGETEPENADGISATIKTVDGQAANQLTFTITASVAGTYTLTPAIEDATGLTLPALTVTVTQAEKDLVVASVTAATVEPITLTQTAADAFTAEGEVTFTVTIGDDSETLTESNLEVTATGVTQGTVALTAPESGNDYTVKVPFTATAATTEEAPATIKLAITGLAEGAEAKEATASITVNAPALTIESITEPAAAEVEVDTENLTAAFTVTTAEGSAWPTATDFTATATGVTVAETGAVSVSGEGTAWTVTVAYAATEPTAESTPATIVLSAGDKTATASITVKAAETPVDPDKTVVTATFGTPAASTLEAGESTTATVTLAVADGEAPTADALTVTVSPADKGVTATIAETDGEITVTVTAAAENVTSGDYTIAIAPKAADADFTISGTPLTIKVNGTVEPEPTPGDLPVTKPEQPENPVVGAPEVEIDGTEMTINFNASPADADGEPAEAVMTVALPAAEGADLDQLEAVVEGNAEVTISETGININASKAEIGETIHIIIRKKQAEAPETQALALLAEGEEEETPETPAEDANIVMTIDVTIYGVEFTTAPATATLGADGSVEVTFATNAKVPGAAADSEETEEGTEATNAAEVTLECEGAEVNGNVITFSEAGTYTVTAKAGNDYVATTTITVKNAPTVTGIEAVNADAAAGTAAIYDLQGRRLTRVNAAGIYIVNGVKTLVR